MSRHHREQAWTTHSPKLRKLIAPTLPARCVSPRCQLGGIVFPSQRWHVGHLRDAALGGEPTLQNVGPIHGKCNTSDGGRAGAAKQGKKRRDMKRLPQW